MGFGGERAFSPCQHLVKQVMSDRKSLVIVGGGFAGVRVAQQLERTLPRDWSMRMLSQDNFITYNPLLPEVVGASLLPSHVVAPLRQMLHRTDLSMVRVTDINTSQKTVEYLGEGAGTLHYDALVIAVGQTANLSLVPGMGTYALPLKTLGDALFVRNRIIARLEHAELQGDIDARQWLTSFVVIGGGFSGVETAGEMLDFIHESLRYYKNVSMEDVMVHLVHSGAYLLPELSMSLGNFAHTKMTKYRLKIHLNARAVRVDGRGVVLNNGTVLSAGTVVCTIGTAPSPLVASMNLPKQKGRLAVAPDMSVPGVDGVWSLGDCAAVPNAQDASVSPPTAQFADRQARLLARNITAYALGKATLPFSYKPMGQMSTVGHNNAVAEIFGFKVSGFLAWLLWRATYLAKIPTFGRKVRLFLEWSWAMFFPPDISHLGFVRSRRPSEGDTAPVSAPGVDVAAPIELALMPVSAAEGILRGSA